MKSATDALIEVYGCKDLEDLKRCFYNNEQSLSKILEAMELYVNGLWISVNKQKPSDEREVLVYAPDSTIIGPILIGRYFKSEKGFAESWTVYDFGESKSDQVITHWMELPPKP